jgi:hypothetical protein
MLPACSTEVCRLLAGTPGRHASSTPAHCTPIQSDPHLISKQSQVPVPCPEGPLRVVMRSVLVGMRTGPLTLSCLSLAPLIRSAHTEGRGEGEGGKGETCQGGTESALLLVHRPLHGEHAAASLRRWRRRALASRT